MAPPVAVSHDPSCRTSSRYRRHWRPSSSRPTCAAGTGRGAATGSRTTGVAAGVSTVTTGAARDGSVGGISSGVAAAAAGGAGVAAICLGVVSVTALGIGVAANCLARLGLAGVLLLDNGARVVLAGVGLAAVLIDLGVARRVAAGVAAICGRAVARGAASVRLTVGRGATTRGAVPALVARVSRALGIAARVLDGVLDVSAVAGGFATSGTSSVRCGWTALSGRVALIHRCALGPVLRDLHSRGLRRVDALQAPSERRCRQQARRPNRSAIGFF